MPKLRPMRLRSCTSTSNLPLARFTVSHVAYGKLYGAYSPVAYRAEYDGLATY